MSRAPLPSSLRSIHCQLQRSDSKKGLLQAKRLEAKRNEIAKRSAFEVVYRERLTAAKQSHGDAMDAAFQRTVALAPWDVVKQGMDRIELLGEWLQSSSTLRWDVSLPSTLRPLGASRRLRVSASWAS